MIDFRIHGAIDFKSLLGEKAHLEAPVFYFTDFFKASENVIEDNSESMDKSSNDEKNDMSVTVPGNQFIEWVEWPEDHYLKGQISEKLFSLRLKSIEWGSTSTFGAPYCLRFTLNNGA